MDAGGPHRVVYPPHLQEGRGDVGQEGPHGPDEESAVRVEDGAARGDGHEGAEDPVDDREDVLLLVVDEVALYDGHQAPGDTGHEGGDTGSGREVPLVESHSEGAAVNTGLEILGFLLC